MLTHQMFVMPNQENSFSSLHKDHLSVDATPDTRDSTFVCLGWALFVECLICCAQEFIPSNNEDPAPVSGNNDMMKAVF